MRFSTVFSVTLAVATVTAAPTISPPSIKRGLEIEEHSIGKRYVPREANNEMSKREPQLTGLLGASTPTTSTLSHSPLMTLHF